VSILFNTGVTRKENDNLCSNKSDDSFKELQDKSSEINNDNTETMVENTPGQMANIGMICVN